MQLLKKVSPLSRASIRLGNSHNLQGSKHIIFAKAGHAKGGSGVYTKEMQNSKFCLILRGDDPQTSRFYDAIATGCIPVIINDGFHLVVAPFKNQINYGSFTITIPESMWHIGPNADPWGSLHFVINLPKADRQLLIKYLLKNGRSLLWNHPQSDVVGRALQKIVSSCL